MLRDLPDGTMCFVDANILCYHIVQTPLLSDVCTQCIQRIVQGAITASTSAVVVAEVIHKVMLTEAVQHYQLDHRGLAHRLQRQRGRIAGLSAHRRVPALIQALSMHVAPVTLALLARAADISIQYRLLTNDAVTMAVMERLGLSCLVTNDDNFDAVPDLVVWKPR